MPAPASARTALRSWPIALAAREAAADDVADHDPDPAAREQERVVPVAADLEVLDRPAW